MNKIRLCCVFHDEKTPSLCVDLTKGSYYCLGCGKNGDVNESEEVKDGLSKHIEKKILREGIFNVSKQQ